MEITNEILIEEPRLALEAEDERVFTALVNLHSRLLFRIAYAVTRNTQDAEDVVQDTFLKIYRARAWRNIRNEKAFLARTVWRVALDKVSRRRRDAGTTSFLHTAAGPEQVVIAVNSSEQVHRLIDSLPEDLRRPLALSAIEDLNSRQIGELLGIPEGTVRTRLMRGRQIVREKLVAVREGHHE